MVGGCSTFGTGASDRSTVASWLQRLCNEHAPEEKILVENYGYYLSDSDREEIEEVRILEALPIRPGDIVLGDWGFSNEVPLLDLKKEGERPHNHGEIFFDIGPFSGHLTENGYRLTAEKIFERLKTDGFFNQSIQHTSIPEKKQNFITNSEQKEISNEKLEVYRDKLKALYEINFSVGAVVMNCNPFTLGHRIWLNRQ